MNCTIMYQPACLQFDPADELLRTLRHAQVPLRQADVDVRFVSNTPNINFQPTSGSFLGLLRQQKCLSVAAAAATTRATAAYCCLLLFVSTPLLRCCCVQVLVARDRGIAA